MAAFAEDLRPIDGAELHRSGPADNALLRRADWRFLLRAEARPRALTLAGGRLGQAAPLVTSAADGPAELVVVGRPSSRRLRRARAALRPGGELYCEWRFPRPFGIARARRALTRCGFEDVRLYWPGPRPSQAPQFWLPLDCEPAVSYLFARKPARGALRAALRRLWPLALRSGLLAPVCATARLPGAAPEPDSRLGSESSCLLLTGGQRAINKVVAVPLRPGDGEPEAIVKYARLPQSERALAREQQALLAMEQDHPGVAGAPRVLDTFRRAGQLAVRETAVHGRPLTSELDAQSFGRWAAALTDWLSKLAAGVAMEPRSSWWRRLVQGPLEQLEHGFQEVLEPRTIERLQERLEQLPDLPIVFEHRDCSPWNVILTAEDQLALLDWESAETRGLPALDLVYFLANAAFVVERSFESASTRQTYRRLLDRDTGIGQVAHSCLTRYMSALGLDPAALPALRLLCWVVHSRSDLRHLELDAAGGRRPGARGGGRAQPPLYLGLALQELEHGERPSG